MCDDRAPPHTATRRDRDSALHADTDWNLEGIDKLRSHQTRWRLD